MGCFSWMKADNLTHVANIVEDKPFKFMIPKEFGGGFIQEKYQGYGRVGTKPNGEAKYDIYELLAFWNANMTYPTYKAESGPSPVKQFLHWDGQFNPMKEIDEHTDENRGIGIDIGCYDKQVDRLEYPPRLASASFKGTYEDLSIPSYSDPNQGWTPIKR